MSPILEDQITLSHIPSTPSPSPPLNIFFITGNPGLIEYYRPFLTLIYSHLRTLYPTRCIQISGSSLLGFCTNSADPHGPYDLEDQIEYIGQELRGVEGDVVLVGHSVGAYILLEVLRRWKAEGGGKARVVGGVCLFPTVTHIAKSPSGKKFGVLCNIPYFPILAGVVVRTLLSWLPFAILNAIVALVTGFPPHAANTTTAFLKTPGGVRQALYLATHELRTITADNWDDELWGVAKASTEKQKTRLYFYFGTGDHWVADETRDELIAARAKNAKDGEVGIGKPVMEIDEWDTPHGFCIKHNEIVARKVVDFVEDIIGRGT